MGAKTPLTKFSVQTCAEGSFSLILGRKGGQVFHVVGKLAAEGSKRPISDHCYAVVNGFKNKNPQCYSYKGEQSLWAQHKMWNSLSDIMSLMTSDEVEAGAPAWFLMNEETGQFCRSNDKKGKARLKGSSSFETEATPTVTQSEPEAAPVADGDDWDEFFD